MFEASFEPESSEVPRPGVLENTFGFLTIVSAAFMVGSFFFGGELIGELQEIPGAAAVLFFGNIWHSLHSRRTGIARENHPAHGLFTGLHTANQRMRTGAKSK